MERALYAIVFKINMLLKGKGKEEYHLFVL